MRKLVVIYFPLFIVIFTTSFGINEVFAYYKHDLLKLIRADLGHHLLGCTAITLGFLLYRKSKETVILESSIREKLSPEKTSVKEGFSKAILMYVKYSKNAGKDKLVVELRNKLTHLFHLLDLRAERQELGEIALKSSSVINDQLSKAEILIDDLGWTLHLLKNSDAKKNIKLALEEIEKAKISTPEDKLRFQCAKAKAFRHLAFLATSEKEEAENLEKCETMVNTSLQDKTLMQSFAATLKCNKAQLLHAKAILKVKRTGFHTQGSVVPVDDNQSIETFNAAILDLEEAIKIFDEIKDTERVIKTQIHYERFLFALGKRTEAEMVKAQKDDLIKKSGFDSSMEDVAIAQFELA